MLIVLAVLSICMLCYSPITRVTHCSFVFLHVIQVFMSCFLVFTRISSLLLSSFPVPLFHQNFFFASFFFSCSSSSPEFLLCLFLFFTRIPHGLSSYFAASCPLSSCLTFRVQYPNFRVKSAAVLLCCLRFLTPTLESSRQF